MFRTEVNIPTLWSRCSLTNPPMQMTRLIIPVIVALLGFLTFPDGQLSMAQDGTDAQKPFITGDGLSFGPAASFSPIASFGG